jgi:hypothetical protein
MIGGTMIYELWDTESRNLIGTYDSEAAALAAVAALAERYGTDAIASLMLGCEDGRGRSRQLASGADLAARARIAGHRSATA